MQPLEKSIRHRLECTIKKARDIAEEAGRIALEQLGVAEPVAFSHLRDDERRLRRRLRAHGRQLGDSLNGGKLQTIERLIEEVAYEHWHRMLFARFLAENNLLMYWPEGDDEPIDVDLETCQGLIDEGAEQATSVWELAGRFAARMLPQIFRQDSPVFQLTLPPEHQFQLEQYLAELPIEVFTASDSLGWVYQFWQAKRKDEVNASGEKIGARELPAVTQLFTEPYMVSFLLDNSLGAWWAARRLGEDDWLNAASEEELRQKAAIPGVPLKYLRFVREEDDRWTPAAGTFSRWPESLSELKTLDPCCGSGHFLVAAFLMLVPMRMEMENLSPRVAVDAVLRDNIHGLELDQRCVELAAFALAMAAWTYPDAGGYRPLPELQVACSGLSVSVAKEEWKQLGLGKKNLTLALDWMHDTFKDAPVLGSLLDPAKSDATKLVEWDELSVLLDQALAKEQSDEQQEAAVVAHGLAKAATLLARNYQWVMTNVPYLSSGKQHERLQRFCDKNYSSAKLDLATVFLDRCLELCSDSGTSSIVLPQNWLFLTSYKKFREKLLKNNTWHLIARLGPKGFQTPMWDFNVQLLTISRGGIKGQGFDFLGGNNASNVMRGTDVSKLPTVTEKSKGLTANELRSVQQDTQLENPDARITLEGDIQGILLSRSAICPRGIVSGDGDQWARKYWEISNFAKWKFLQGTTSESCFYSGLDKVIDWSYEGDGMLRPGRDNLALNKVGVNVSLMSTLPVTLYMGGFYDQTTATIAPNESDDLSPLFAYCISDNFSVNIRKIDQKLNVTPATLIKVPFDIDHWTKVARENYPNGLPKPHSGDPTQWIFHGHPCGSVIWDEKEKWTVNGHFRTDETVLHIATARLLGYRWPAELDAEMELADEQREWVNRCGALLPYADEDGIVCIPPVRGESSAADRLLNPLAAAYGDHWSNDILAQLLKSVGHAGKSLDSWLRDKFFTQHCKLFQHRPFIWHIWDGLTDGFSVLVNYRKLNTKLLETLIYTYLGDWINRQKDDIGTGVDGARERLAAAEGLKKKLELILEGEAPYDIFVRWKPLEGQPIGWDPDLNDGVRINIRPFMTVGDIRKKGAGVLRDKPNIKWGKDRGKDVESTPWYHLGPSYGGKEGDRINDHHLTLKEKKNAREKT